MNKAGDLFQLLLNLSHIRSRSKVTELYLESIGNLFPSLTLRYADTRPDGAVSSLPVVTPHSSHGYIVSVGAEPLSEEDQTLLHNATQMFAIILERLDFTEELEKERSSIQRLADERLMNLQSTMEQLRQSRSAYINLVEDLTRENEERKRAQEALRESVYFFQESQQAAFIGSYKCDFSTGYWESSEVLDQIFGIGREYERTIQNWIAIVHPYDREIMARYLQEEVIAKCAPFDREYRIVRLHDGALRWVIGHGKVGIDGEGNAQSLIGTIQDITVRKQAEDALKVLATSFAHLSGKQFFEAVSRHIATALDVDFVFVGEYHSRNETVNVLGGYAHGVAMDDMSYSLADTPCNNVIGRYICCYPSNVQTQFPKDALLKEMGIESYLGAPLFDKEHRPIGIMVALHSKPLSDSQAVLMLFNTFLDRVSAEMLKNRAELEKARLEGQLLQAQKMESVGRLAGGVAHDFNNMLGVILGHTELAMEQMDPAQPIFADLREVRNAAERSANLTRQLLAFARQQTVAPKILDLNETVEGMLKMLRRIIGEDIELAWLPGKNLGPVKMDPSQIDQILANLCVNARDAIANTGKVTIKTDTANFDETYSANHEGVAPSEYVLLAVSDDGCGMDKETLNNVFEPFFTTKKVGKGTGLGLATVYGIVKQNDGFINVDSEPGHGTTFRIYLPRQWIKAPLEVKDDVKNLAPRGEQTILLVEDEPAILRVTAKLLERQGYKILAATTAGEAIRIAKEYTGPIHLLMTDVIMPEMNGRDLAKNLLSLYPDLKRLFMSGYTADVIAHHGVLNEGVHFIQKPFSRDTLVAKVGEALHSEG